MNAKTSASILIILSIFYGATIGILASLESTAVATVATIGGLILGALWVTRGILLRD